MVNDMLSAKVEAPIDDNYSDDQLTYMPYYTLLTATADAARRAPALASLERTWRATKIGRADLWAAIYMALTGASRGHGRPGHSHEPMIVGFCGGCTQKTWGGYEQLTTTPPPVARHEAAGGHGLAGVEPADLAARADQLERLQRSGW